MKYQLLNYTNSFLSLKYKNKQMFSELFSFINKKEQADKRFVCEYLVCYVMQELALNSILAFRELNY